MKAPKTIHDRFDLFIDYFEKSDVLTQLAIESLIRFPRLMDMLEAVEQLGNMSNEKPKTSSLAYFKDKGEIFKTETEDNFPFFHASSTVSIWGAMEAYIKDIIAICIQEDPSFLETDTIQRVKIPFSIFSKMSRVEQNYHLVTEVERKIQSNLKSGISRFESLLGEFCLDGEVDDTSRRTFIELSNVRNVLVHRGGFADNKLVDNCPWLPINVGDLVKIDAKTQFRYHNEVGIYAADVQARVLDHFNASTARVNKLSKDLREVREAYKN